MAWDHPECSLMGTLGDGTTSVMERDSFSQTVVWRHSNGCLFHLLNYFLLEIAYKFFGDIKSCQEDMFYYTR